jgi:hypothetical protein
MNFKVKIHLAINADRHSYIVRCVDDLTEECVIQKIEQGKKRYGYRASG